MKYCTLFVREYLIRFVGLFVKEWRFEGKRLRIARVLDRKLGP